MYSRQKREPRTTHNNRARRYDAKVRRWRVIIAYQLRQHFTAVVGMPNNEVTRRIVANRSGNVEHRFFAAKQRKHIRQRKTPMPYMNIKDVFSGWWLEETGEISKEAYDAFTINKTHAQ